ncbi:MAG: type II 3-dehydroquinate dehydratase [Anaerolineaceae bacterium]|nr:MAG: type II 3-dehydroquinate dehydratase [Anaerolineaceae bacterium]
MRVLIINGPNLNFLGIREKGVYGNRDYSALLDLIEEKAKELNIEVETFQSNGEGEIIDRLQRAYYDKVDGIIINPAAYTHYSYAIRDALASLSIPKIEVHISNIHEREEFRKISVTAPVCDEQIMGHGLEGYLMAMDAIIKLVYNNL